jgi:hypothetical protein|tara:strand:- start:591 stop:944 length:354 start_codon:yes stop_codon:yes gene_type:complete
MNTYRRYTEMGFNPKTYNLFQQIDISNALEKVNKYIEESDLEEVKVTIPCDSPFSLKMRMHRYIKAYREQMSNKEDVDHQKYDMLVITAIDNAVEISSVLDKMEDLVIKDSKTGVII